MTDRLRRIKVVADLPNTGMCNRLLCWARALVFGNLNDLDVEVYGWSKFRLGPWLRRERSKRLYHDFFKKEISSLKALNYHFYKYMRKNRLLIEPSVLTTPKDKVDAEYVVFNDFPRMSNGIDLFCELRGHREFIRESFWSSLSNHLINELEQKQKPYIGVHVRRGDFKGSKCFVSDNYFRDMIISLRDKVGIDKQVILFSDGNEADLKAILQLENVSMEKGNSDIMDLLVLSQSQIIVTSLRSTFSYWAGFLSDSPIVLHPDHEWGNIRPKDLNLFEGTIDRFHA